MRIRLLAGQEILTICDGRIGGPFDRVDATIRVGAGVFHPGLINAHDHLHRNHYPRVGARPYPNAYVWGAHIHARFATELAHARSLPRHSALLFGALKNILGGVTTAVHHDPWEPAFDHEFPIRVPRLATADSLGLDPALASPRYQRDAARMAMHLAEGTDLGAAEEVREADGLGLLDERFLCVHVVGADADGIRRIRRSGAAVVWCPTSNDFLLGRTLPPALVATRTDTLIGTDALVSGEGTILDELRAARRLGYVSDERLIAGVGLTAARRLGLAEPSLAAGSPADVILLRASLLDADAADVALVLVGGMPRLADAALGEIFERAGVPSEPLVVRGQPKLVAAPLATIAHEVFELSPECARIVEAQKARAEA